NASLNGVCTKETGLRSPVSGSSRTSPPETGSKRVYAMNRPSGDQAVGTTRSAESSTRSSFAPPLDAFTYIPNGLLRCAPNAIRLPSGDQTGDTLCSAASNVSRVVVPRSGSSTQTSPPLDSCRCAATNRPSTERSIPRMRTGDPTVPTVFPVRSTHVNTCSSAMASPCRYVRTPFSETENAATPFNELVATRSATGKGSPVIRSLSLSNACAIRVPCLENNTYPAAYAAPLSVVVSPIVSFESRLPTRIDGPPVIGRDRRNRKWRPSGRNHGNR